MYKTTGRGHGLALGAEALPAVMNLGRGVELAAGAAGRAGERAAVLLLVSASGGVVGTGLEEELADVGRTVAVVGPAAPSFGMSFRFLTKKPNWAPTVKEF